MSFRGRNTSKSLLPFGLEYNDILSNGFSTEKPTLTLPIHGKLTEDEIDSATQSISFAQRMLDGAFYTGTIYDATHFQSINKNLKRKNTEPDGIERYSDRYKKVKKIGKTIEEHPYQLEFFPQELYSVMGVTGKQKKKLLDLSTYKSNGGLKQFESKPVAIANVNDDDVDEAKSILEKLKTMTDDIDENQDDAEIEEDEEEDLDDEFEEDDDDDYNAEKYFDDGDDDGGDDDGDEAAF